MPIWIMSQDKNALIECSAFTIRGITPTQYAIVNEKNIQLGEYFSHKDAELALQHLAEQVKPVKMLERGEFGNGKK